MDRIFLTPSNISYLNEQRKTREEEYFVLAFLRGYAEEQKLTKTSERNIQETLGEMCIVKNKIMPIELKIYSVGNTSKLGKWVKEIEELNTIELRKVDKLIERWIEEQNHIKNVKNLNW